MTTVTTAQANKLYQVALFTAANRNRSMVNILTEQKDAPKAVSPDKKSTKQTSAGAPVVRITDLKKQAGDEVTFSIMHNSLNVRRWGMSALKAVVKTSAMLIFP